MRNFLKEIKDRILVYDGSKGTMLHQLGMQGGECPELWNVTHSEEVKKVYSMYKEAGADVIQTNTFQGNRLKLSEYSLGDRTYELNYEGARLAREVMGNDGFVAASIGTIGILLEPSGTLTFEQAYETYKEQVKAVAEGGADIINFETFTDVADLRIALLAAKDTVDLPVICSVAFEANGRTLMGTDPYTAAVILKSLGADMIGTNCSLGPAHLVDIVKKLSEVGGIYMSVKPNAGLPEMVDGKAVFKESPEHFAELTREFVSYGARLIGGCCGTNPEFIKAIKSAVSEMEAPKPANKTEQLITSGTKCLVLDNIQKLELGHMDAALEGDFKEAVMKEDIDSVVDIALELASEDFEAVYINVDKAAGSEKLLAQVVNTAQGYIKMPFIIETENAEALAEALRIYRGKAGVVVDRYSNDIMQDLLLVARKYGSTVIHSSLL